MRKFSFVLRALWIFAPGILFLILGLFLFTSLPQGKDVIYQSTDGPGSWRTGLYLLLATAFWVFITWYTARLIAYNRADLYVKAPWVLYHFPRFSGFSVFLVLWLAVYLIDDVEKEHSSRAWAIALADIALYFLAGIRLEGPLNQKISPVQRRRLITIRRAVIGLLLLACAWVVAQWKDNRVQVLLYTLPLFQWGFLFLVLIRHPIYASDPAPAGGGSGFPNWRLWRRFTRWVFRGASEKFDVEFEKPVFFVFNALALLALTCYLLSVLYLPFARGLTSFPLVLLSFGILLGVVNIIALVSYRRQVNFNFLLIGLIILAGFLFETHKVRLLEAPASAESAYARRASFQRYTEAWVRWHQAALDRDTGKGFPVFFVLADGGASRSGYWAASVLAALHESTRLHAGSHRSFFMDHLFCLSGASGGSVGNAAFLSAYGLQQRQPALNTDSLCRTYLGNDFLVFPLARMLGPEILHPLFGWIGGWGDRAVALEQGMDYPSQKESWMGRWMRGSFTQLLPDSNNRFPILSINTTRVNDGGPGLVSTIHIDSSNGVFGRRVDVLDSLPPGTDIRVSTAVVLGARFPYMSPGGKLRNSYYVDGGYFDNSGAGVVHEMLLELNRMAGDTTVPYRRYLKRLHFYVLHLSNTPFRRPGVNDPIHPVVNDLATPLLTLAGSYNSQTSVNDARLRNYLKELNRDRNSYLVVNLYREKVVESIPMNWVISNKVRRVMDTRIGEKRELDTLIKRIKEGRADSLFQGLE